MITIMSFFTNNGAIATGLTPQISIRKVSDGTLVVDNQDMTETGSGFYKYEFSGDETIDYVIVVDGGTTLTTAERYVFAGTDLRNISNNIDKIVKFESGRWKIDKNTKQMIFFAEDNTTEIARFNLFDENGVATISNVMERVKV